jgi:hypothetical protein
MWAVGLCAASFVMWARGLWALGPWALDLQDACYGPLCCVLVSYGPVGCEFWAVGCGLSAVSCEL